MNDIYRIFIVLLGIGVVTFPILFWRKRLYFEKRKYKNAKNLKFTKSLQQIQGSLIARRGWMLKYGDTLEVMPNIYWCELLLSEPGIGNVKQIDSIYIKSDRFNYFRYISGELFLAYLCNLDEIGTSLIPANIAAFLGKYNVSIDSGDWGLLLMKNNGYFKGFEVEEILKDIEEVKYLTKKLKSN